MRKIAIVQAMALMAAPLLAEVHTLTLSQAVERARAQNPDVLLAKLDASKAAEAVRLEHDPFSPKAFVGSNVGYTYGMPMSIDGAAPSVVQARTVMTVFDKPQKLREAQAKEQARGAGISVESRQQEAVLRTVELYLDAAHAAQSLAPSRESAESAARIEGLVRARVEEGREIPLAVRQSALETAKARQLALRFEQNANVLGITLAEVLGYPAGDDVRPAAESETTPAMPDGESAALEAAYRQSAELRRIDSAVAAQRIAIRAAQASKLPRLTFAAQYGLFAKFNNYEDYFRRFSRNNVQAGVSVELPVLLGPAAKAQANQSQAEIDRLMIEANRLRSRIAVDVRRDYASLREAEVGRDVARLDLDVAREALDVTRARMEEGRAALADVERARQAESQKWLAYYDSLHALERARYSVLARAGLLK